MFSLLLFVFVFCKSTVSCNNTDIEYKLILLQKQIDEIKSTKFIFEKGILNLICDIGYIKTIDRPIFRWPTNTNCVCPHEMIINNQIWYDREARNCKCEVNFGVNFLEKPKLLFNTYQSTSWGISYFSNPSILDDYMVIHSGMWGSWPARNYLKNMTIYNDKFIVYFGNTTANLTIGNSVYWYAFGYIRK
jgi:hypothetical protein